MSVFQGLTKIESTPILLGRNLRLERARGVT